MNTNKQLIGQAGRLLASIKELLTANNLTELDFSDLDVEQADPVLVIWHDKHCDPCDDPVLKVLLDDDGLSLEVDARNFGKTVRIYEDDFADKVNWLTGIRDNVVEVLRLRGIAAELKPEDPFHELLSRQEQLSRDMEIYIRETLLRHPKHRMTIILPEEEAGLSCNYPATVSWRDDGDLSLTIMCVHLSAQGDLLMDGMNPDIGIESCNNNILADHYPAILRFIDEVIINSKKEMEKQLKDYTKEEFATNKDEINSLIVEQACETASAMLEKAHPNEVVNEIDPDGDGEYTRYKEEFQVEFDQYYDAERDSLAVEIGFDFDAEDGIRTEI